MSESAGGHNLLLPFDTDDPMFVRGVEIGRLWERAKNDADEFDEIVHASNAEMVLRVAEATEREVRSEEHGDTGRGDAWIQVYFGEANVV